jgi:hypothetical protein
VFIEVSPEANWLSVRLQRFRVSKQDLHRT